MKPLFTMRSVREQRSSCTNYRMIFLSLDPSSEPFIRKSEKLILLVVRALAMEKAVATMMMTNTVISSCMQTTKIVMISRVQKSIRITRGRKKIEGAMLRRV